MDLKVILLNGINIQIEMINGSKKKWAELVKNVLEENMNVNLFIYNETLIDALCLANMKHTDTLYRTGETPGTPDPKKDNMYVVTLDPCAGTGGDNAPIQVVELPTMKQVGEWCPIKHLLKDKLEHYEKF